MILENFGLKVGVICNIESDSVLEGFVVKIDFVVGCFCREGVKVNFYIVILNKSFILGNYKEYNYKDIFKDF